MNIFFKRKIFCLFVSLMMIGGLFGVSTHVNAADVVAKVGTKEYETLQAAIDATDNGSTITLIADVTENIMIKKGLTVKLDLNGHKVTNDGQFDTITNYGTLTINDSKGNGIVDNIATFQVKNQSDECPYPGSGNNRQVGSAVRNNVGATATLNGGTYERSKESRSPLNSCYTLRNQGTMEINNGVTVKNTGTYSAMIGNGFYDGENDNPTKVYPELTVNGGNFIGGNYNIKNDDYGVLTINGGDFSIDHNWNVLNYNEVTINGGTFLNTKGWNVYAGMDKDYEFEDGMLKITGGMFKTPYSTTYCLQLDTNDLKLVEVTGGTYDNTMEATDWHVSNSKEQDPKIIPENYTKVAVGTKDKENYIFKVVPIKEKDSLGSFKVDVSETKSIDLSKINDLENVRVYAIEEATNSQGANDVAMRTAQIRYNGEKIETDTADVQYDATTKTLKYTGKEYGDVTFALYYTDSVNPTEYVKRTLTINVKKSVGSIHVKVEGKLPSDNYTYEIYNSSNQLITSGILKDNLTTSDLPLDTYKIIIKDDKGNDLGEKVVTNGATKTLSKDGDEIEFIVSIKNNEIVSEVKGDETESNESISVKGDELDTNKKKVNTSDNTDIYIVAGVCIVSACLIFFLLKKNKHS